MEKPLVSEEGWKDALAGLPAFEVPIGPVLFVAPHPDDETLAAGGFLAALSEAGTPVSVVAVTDGSAAYAAAGDPELAERRKQEQTAALAILGVPDRQIFRLGLPDRCIHEHEEELARRLIHLLGRAGRNVTLIAPWRGDFHADHEAAGRAAETAATEQGVRLVRWFWWSWHRRTLDELSDLPLRKFRLEHRWVARKISALAEHRSQLGEDAILPNSVLLPARRNFEVFA